MDELTTQELRKEIEQLHSIISAQEVALAMQAKAIFDLQATLVRISGTLMSEISDIKQKGLSK